MADKIEKKWKIGDVVRLKSGGEKMTVNGFDSSSWDGSYTGKVLCAWFDGKKNLFATLHQDALELAKD